MTKLANRSGRDRMRPLGGELLRHRDFRLLWAAEAVSDLGRGVSVLAIPMVAIRALHTDTFEVAALSAAGSSAYLLVSLPAGALVDRTRRRCIMMIMDASQLPGARLHTARSGNRNPQPRPAARSYISGRRAHGVLHCRLPALPAYVHRGESTSPKGTRNSLAALSSRPSSRQAWPGGWCKHSAALTPLRRMPPAFWSFWSR